MASQEDIDANVKRIVNNVSLAYKELRLSDFFACIVKLMECAEAIPILIGADKKKVVKSVLTQIVNTINIPLQRDRELIMLLINSGIIDLIIDGIVKLTKEGCKINIQELANKCNCCCKDGKCSLL